MSHSNTESFLVKRKVEPVANDRTFLWMAWRVDSGFRFTKNDGRTMGNSGFMTEADFWKEFELPV